MLKRNITVKINWILENLLFPILREWRFMMHIIIWFAYGKYTKYILDFKDKYPDLTEEEINKYYKLIVDAPINQKRKTDLNKSCIDYILNNIKGDTVLDAACGRGYMVEKIKKSGYSIIGVDVAFNDKQSKRAEYVKGSLQHLPFKDNEFDTVICTHALEHIREYREAMHELKRVASKRIIIVMPKQREYKYTPDLHVNFCPYLYRFKEFLNEGGLNGSNCFILEHDFVGVYDIKS